MNAHTTVKPTFSERLAGYIVGERFERIGKAAVARVKHIIPYHLALAFRGIKAQDADGMRAVAFAHAMSEGGGTATLIGHSDKATMVDAVFANCQMMRSFGLDDVIFRTGVHPALVTLPIALALGERHHATGAELIAAIATGYEMLGKFAQWSWSLETPRRATMPFGPFGAVATAAKMLELDQVQTTSALGFAANTAMGLAENDAGPMSHFYSMVCRNGITSGVLAKMGAWGSPTALEGRFGFIEAFLGSVAIDQDAMIASLGHDYAVMESSEKRYPGTGLNQVPIELVRALVKETGLCTADVESIHVTFPTERQNFAAGHGKGPFTKPIAPSSVAFQFGLLFLDGDLNFARYDEIDNPDILRIVERTTFSFAQGKSIRYARVEVRTTDGKSFVREGDDFAFEPLSIEQLMDNARGVLPNAKVAHAVELIENLEKLDDVAELTAALVP